MSNPSPSPAARLTHTVPVLRQAMRVLEAVAQRQDAAATNKSLALSLQIPGSTCYRILQTFVESGWLRRRAGGAFELSFGLVPLLRPLLRHEVLIETVREPLESLAKTTGLTAKLSVQQGDYAVTIFSAPSPRPTAIASRVGSLSSLAIGSSGAAFLSILDEKQLAQVLQSAHRDVWKYQKRADVLRRVREMRRNDVAYDQGSYQPNIHTLSTRIFAARDELVGVITLLGFPQDFTSPRKSALIKLLKDTGQQVSDRLQNPGQAEDSP